jgi:hypothetical protein
VDGDDLCCGCGGTGWVPYHSETKDGGFEEAYRLCPKGHATVRCGPGYYCKEHIVAIHDGRNIDDPCEAI